MPDLTVDVDVYCGRCGDVLQAEFKEGYQRSNKCNVEPCEKCLEVAKDEGEEVGHTRGLADAEVDHET